MDRLTDFEHHIIGRVHDVVDAANAELFQDRAQPVRAGADLHAAYNPGDVARAKFRVFDAHRDQVLRTELRIRQPNLGDFERMPRDRAYFPRDADDAVEVRTIGRDFKIIDHVAGSPADV